VLGLTYGVRKARARSDSVNYSLVFKGPTRNPLSERTLKTLDAQATYGLWSQPPTMVEDVQ
jgi:hypothetical protein